MNRVFKLRHFELSKLVTEGALQEFCHDHISKNKARSPIMEAVHDAATDLHRLGFIDHRVAGADDGAIAMQLAGKLGIAHRRVHPG